MSLLIGRKRTILCLRGFSLVEVALAIGIVAFALLSIVSLIPTGLGTFRSSVHLSVQDQVFQKVITDALQTDYSTLVDLTDNSSLLSDPADVPAGFSFRAPKISAPSLRYFDYQGEELSSSASALYFVNTIITPQASFYSGGATRLTPISATVQVTVEIALNPGNLPLTFSNNSIQPQTGITITKGFTLVAESN